MIRTPVWQYRATLEWVKTVFLSELAPERGRVAQLGVTDGADVGKFARAQLSHVTAVDDEESIERMREKWEAREKPFTADFVEADPLDPFTWADKLAQNPVQLLLVSDALDNICESSARCDAWLAAAARAVEPGGFIAGVCIDSAQAWSRAQKAALEDAGGTTGVVSDDLFDVAYARGLDSFSAFGTTVVLTLHEGDAAPANDQSARPRSLVHFASFMRLAAQHGLRFVEASNLLEFFEDHRRAHQTTMRRCGVVASDKARIEQAKLIGLFSTLVLQKMTVHGEQNDQR